MAQQTRRVFAGVTQLAAQQLDATKSELQLLEQVNRVAAAQYAELDDSVESLSGVVEEVTQARELVFLCARPYRMFVPPSSHPCLIATPPPPHPPPDRIPVPRLPLYFLLFPSQTRNSQATSQK